MSAIIVVYTDSLLSTGDGQLFNFQVDPLTLQLSNQKKVSIGTQPLTLNTFSASGTTHVFAASDRPTVIHSSNHKILYSDVNLKVGPSSVRTATVSRVLNLLPHTRI